MATEIGNSVFQLVLQHVPQACDTHWVISDLLYESIPTGNQGNQEASAEMQRVDLFNHLSDNTGQPRHTERHLH